MKTTLKTLFLLLFASGFLVACEQCTNVTYNEPTVAESEWLVYGGPKQVIADTKVNLKDTILFKNERNDTIRYFRTGTYAQETPSEGYNVDDKCIEQLDTQVTNVIEDQARENPLLATSILRKSDALIVTIGVDRTGNWEIDTNGQTQSGVKVLQRVYNDVYELTGT
ncbi:hypothetical protein GCM10028895_00860 [Pontibacter rugosus]